MKILFVEDDEHTSALITATLSAHRYAVDIVTDGVAGVDMATHWSYDLILLDVLLPTLSGIEVCRCLRAQNVRTPILILTTKDSDEDVIAGLDAGADDYVAKSCAPSQLLARVRALLRRGGSGAASPLLAWENLCLDPALARVTYNQATVPLRPREYSLLELFLRNPQRLLSRQAIIDHLWSIEETPVEGSVTNLVKDLRQRLKAAGMKADLIETVYGLGYRLKPAPVASSVASRTGTESDLKGSAVTFMSVGVDSSSGDLLRSEQRGLGRIQQISDRFQDSLAQRMEVLQATENSFQTGKCSIYQQKVAQAEAHKLAGGLGTFGYAKASEIAHAIEYLLDAQVSQEVKFAHQFSQLLQELQQELTPSPSRRGSTAANS